MSARGVTQVALDGSIAEERMVDPTRNGVDVW